MEFIRIIIGFLGWVCSSTGGALVCGTKGCGFESHHTPHHFSHFHGEVVLFFVFFATKDDMIMTINMNQSPTPKTKFLKFLIK